MPKPKPKYATLRMLAARVNVSPQAISQGLRTGRVERGITWVRGRPVITDLETAVKEWEDSWDPMRDPRVWS